MRYNGADLESVHPAIGRALEILPGMAARDIATVETTGGEVVTAVYAARDEFRLRVNIAARSYAEALEARLQLAAWAASSGRQTARLEPTHLHGKAYDAIVKSVGDIEKRFGTVEVVFMLPSPFLYDIAPSIVTAAKAAELSMMVSGSAPALPTICWAPATGVESAEISLDGRTILAMQKNSVPSGKTLQLRLDTGAVTVDGAAADDKVLFDRSDLDAELTPGMHTLRANAAGAWDVRWHNRWQ